jgi:hypothetical protein
MQQCNLCLYRQGRLKCPKRKKYYCLKGHFSQLIFCLVECPLIAANVLQLQKVGDFGAKSLSASSELDTKHKASFNH